MLLNQDPNSVHSEMALFFLIGVLRGFPAAAYRRTPRRKPLCGLEQNKNCSLLNWTPIVFILNLWSDTNYTSSLVLKKKDYPFSDDSVTRPLN
jgi:hypothetical protein